MVLWFRRNYCTCAPMLYIAELCEDCAIANEIDYAWASIHDNGHVITACDVRLQQRIGQFQRKKGKFCHGVTVIIAPMATSQLLATDELDLFWQCSLETYHCHRLRVFLQLRFYGNAIILSLELPYSLGLLIASRHTVLSIQSTWLTQHAKMKILVYHFHSDLNHSNLQTAKLPLLKLDLSPKICLTSAVNCSFK